MENLERQLTEASDEIIRYDKRLTEIGGQLAESRKQWDELKNFIDKLEEKKSVKH